MNFYNDIDPDSCAWTRELICAGLIPKGEVSQASIKDLKAHELLEFNQCHFFCGIAGWPLAYAIAGVGENENADSGSCPCQPFSGTGKQMGFADPRHLWPAFRRIINKRRPAKIYGEQVASALGREWLSRVFSDLEIMGYAGSGADLCSAGVGAPNIRQRLYWCGECVGAANAASEQFREAGNSVSGETEWAGGRCAAMRVEHPESDGRFQRGAESSRRSIAGGCGVGRLAEPNGGQRNGVADGEGRQCDGAQAGRKQGDGEFESGGDLSRLGYADDARREGRLVRWDGGYERATGAPMLGMWSDAELVFCRDQKWRRIEPGSFPLVAGVPSRVGPLLTELRKLGKSSVSFARANRNIRLKGYGNAINPWVAAEFILASRESGSDRAVMPRKAETIDL